MSRKIVALAVAALAATALPFPVNAFCRGCVIETADAARAQAFPPGAMNRATCHIEKQRRRINGRYRWRRVEVCD